VIVSHNFFKTRPGVRASLPIILAVIKTTIETTQALFAREKSRQPEGFGPWPHDPN
jgi:hypothetical protein